LSSAFTVPFEQCDAGEIRRVGGKCASLGELARAGFAVPPGFCVTTRAYADFVERAGLGTIVREALAGLDVEDGEALARAGEGIRTAFESAPVPAEIADAVRAGLALLGDGPVAVRSSATAEDLPEASFTGQQDTYLNIVGADAVIDAVRRCWASLWTDRAIAYRTRNGIDHAQVRLACVVQRLIAADAAGVLFTANPVSGRRTEVVLDASPGLGEAIVAGLVTPDHYVIRKGIAGREPAIRERQIAEKAVAIEPAAGGGIVRRELVGDERCRPV
jgi:pyruvate,water dikinase